MASIPPNAPTLVAERTEGGDMLESTVMSGGRPNTSDEPSLLRRGDVLGRYVVLDMLGHGGMGVVYAAYDPELDRKVAIKLVKVLKGSAEGTAGRSRLLREAQALARLTHPNIVGVYDVGTWQGAVFVAMEFIEGETVDAWARRRHAEDRWSWREVLDVMVPAGRGLVQAHASGIVHRDFKPENVMISHTGRVIVLDFGLARASEGGPESLTMSGSVTTSRPSTSMQVRLTATGSVMGTPAYMAPEQLGAGVTNESSDQFSFCVSLYYALYGERPFPGENMPELTDSVLSGEIRPPPKGTKVPAWLRRVVLRGLATQANERYPTMADLLGALARDPARRRTRILAGVAATAVIGGAWVAAQQVVPAEDPCAQVDHAMKDAWGPPQRAALERAFRHEAKAYSEQSIERVEAALERFAGRWVDERRAACEAGRKAGTDAGREAGLSAACLDEHLRRFEVLVRLFGDADQQLVANAMTAVQELPDPGQCRDGEGYRRAAPLPDDPADQERAEALRLQMIQIQALAIAGRVKEADERIGEVLAESRALGFEPLIADVLRAVGSSKAQLGQYAAAQAALEEGLLLARAHGLERLQIHLLSPLIFIHTSYTSHYDLALWHSQVQEVLIDQYDPRPINKARALLDRGRLQDRRGRPEAAIELMERAAKIHEQDESSPGAQESLVVTYSNLSSAYMRLDRFDDAARVLERADEVAATALGAGHPHRGNLLAQWARVEAGRDNHAGSVSKLRAALEIFEGAYGGHHPNISAVLNGLGIQLESVGKPDEAVHTLRRALGVVVEAYGEEHPQVAIIESNLGNTLRRKGEAQEALELHRRAYETRTAIADSIEERYEALDNIGDDLRELGRCKEAEAEYRAANALREEEGDFARSGAYYAMVGIGLCQWHTGDVRRALPTLEAARIQAIGEDHAEPDAPEMLAVTRFALAMVLTQRGQDAARAEQLAKAARSFWAKDPTLYAGLIAQFDSWKETGKTVMPRY